MKKTYRNLLLVFFIICLNTCSLLAAPIKINGIEFHVDNIIIKNSGDSEPPFLSLDFIIYNSTDNLKLDITDKLGFYLRDEFGNSYARILSSSEHSKLSTKQSVYPNQTFTIKLAFELPVAKAPKAILRFDGLSLGMGAGEISIPLAGSKNDDIKSSIRIIVPENGAVVERGRLIHLNVLVTGPRVPDGIIIDSFDYTYEDHYPTLDNVYDLNIPKNSILGPQSINVIAKWKNNTATEDITSSDNIVIYVKDATTVDVF